MAASFSLLRSRASASVRCRWVTAASSTNATTAAATSTATQPSIRWIHHDKAPLLPAIRRMEVIRSSPHHSTSPFSATRRTMVVVTQTKSSELPPPLQEQMDISDTKGQRFLQFSKNSDVLTVTPSCIKRIEKLVDQRKKAGENGDLYYLRVFVDAGGCSGFTYKFELDSSELNEEEDIVVHYAVNEKDGERTIPRLVVDETSLGFIRGSKIDYIQEMIKSSFEVSENPQSESACGCGSSFALKNFSANPALD
jgi:iron-sulfur cluster assembly 2